MPKNLGNISDPKDIVTKEYLEDKCILKSNAPKLIVGTSVLSSNSSTISIPDSIVDTENMLVYHNGLLITLSENYTVSDRSINLESYIANAGDIFTFICVQ